VFQQTAIVARGYSPVGQHVCMVSYLV